MTEVDSLMKTYEEGLEAAAKACEAMVVGGRAWTVEQQIAADALFAAAKIIRSLQEGQPIPTLPHARIPTFAIAEPPRTITDHHDGHGLAESIVVEADAFGPGGASHYYRVTVDNHPVAGIQYQCGPRHEPGSQPGVLDSVLLAIVVDRMRCFNEGPYKARENALVMTKAEEGLHWLKHRVDARARRGVLGKNTP